MTYFDARELPKPRREYVCWLDVMGMEAQMKYSAAVSANFVFKLHVAALEAPGERMRLYPIMDGLYGCSPSRAVMDAFMSSVLSSLVETFRAQSVPHFRFVVRGAVAYGDVYHGAEVGNAASKTLSANPAYRAAIMLGPPVVDANRTEPEAPPFGIAATSPRLQ
jgi:hypothetical protein